MAKKIDLNETLIIKEYLGGKSSLILSKEFGVSKPTILSVLKKHNVTRKRNRCDSLKIIKNDNKYVILRKCPQCGSDVKTTSKDRIIACRNYFNLRNSLCKNCSIINQKGNGNPFYGKKHTGESKQKISNSRKGKATGKENSMANPKHRDKARKNLKKKWDEGNMEHARKIMSEKMKETRRLGKIKSVIRSKAEYEIIKKIKEIGYKVKSSFRVDTKICDIFIPKLNLIIEYNGDYWHCNPKKYPSDYFHSVKNMTAKELWDYDKNKIDLVRNKGYNLEVIWESEYKKNQNIINKLIKKYE
jgi:G:T-mismatch repair DNA endonuclease (very short patch repair protein)